MAFSQDFFGLQIAFARKAAGLQAVSFEQALLSYTTFFVRFGLGRSFDPAAPRWQEYLHLLRSAQDSTAATYHFYLQQPDGHAVDGIVRREGCFSYAHGQAGFIHLHFYNSGDTPSPLSREHATHRRADLYRLFKYIRQHEPPGLILRGGSWLYNIEAYRRLFPPAYLASAQPAEGRFQNMSLWGQMLDSKGAVKPAMAEPFLQRLQQAENMSAFAACFAFQPLRLQAPVSVFHEFYAA